MNKKLLISVAGIAVLGAVLAALPSHSSALQARAPEPQSDERQQVVRAPEARNFEFSFGEGSWLGVETGEVTSEKAKELKLPAERGVVLEKIMEDGPAGKAGLKENDVLTEINGQRVEGTAQFRRMIREIPAGRTVQFTVWRDGRSQQIAATLGKADDEHSNWFHAAPGAFAFNLPEVSELPQLPDVEFDGLLGMASRPRLGIDAEDLSGKLGTFFGAPDGEGILVRDVNSGSAAEKAGLKAGDVIVSLNGERLRSVGDLRAKLAAQHASDKPASVKLGVIRNKSEIPITVELPAPGPRARRTVLHGTNI
jgi:S1-C subfamily serine protease